MGIKTECQRVITCDRCGVAYIEARTRKNTIRLAKLAGWIIIGQRVTCPKCYAWICRCVEAEGVLVKEG